MELNARTSTEFDENYYCCVFMSEYLKNVSGRPVNNDSFLGGIPNPSFIYATNLDSYFDLMNQINTNGQSNGVVSCVAIPKKFCKYHAINITTDPEQPPITPSNPSASNYLGSPYASNFTISQQYNPPTHNGIDMYGSDNLNIYSTCSGRVVYAQYHQGDTWESSYGNLVCIYNLSNQCYYLYGHLDSYCVSVGQIVAAGDKIGVQGNTGGSYGSHLHYQITGGSDMWDKSDTRNPASAEFSSQFKNQEGTY